MTHYLIFSRHPFFIFAKQGEISESASPPHAGLFFPGEAMRSDRKHVRVFAERRDRHTAKARSPPAEAKTEYNPPA
jgi:hypothetical protein